MDEQQYFNEHVAKALAMSEAIANLANTHKAFRRRRLQSHCENSNGCMPQSHAATSKETS